MTLSATPGDPVITSVEQQKRNPRRYNIFLNDVYAFSVHEDVLVKHRLLKGQQVNEQRMAEILREEELFEAMQMCIRLIGRRPRSLKEVRDRMTEKGYDPPIIEQVTQKLADDRYIDDGQFAIAWTEQRIFSQKKGKKWIRQELRQKGVPSEHIQSALDQVDAEDEFRSAFELAAKKCRTVQQADSETKRKLAAFLLRRGYSNSIVKRTLSELMSDHHVNDDV